MGLGPKHPRLKHPQGCWDHYYVDGEGHVENTRGMRVSPLHETTTPDRPSILVFYVEGGIQPVQGFWARPTVPSRREFPWWSCD